MGEFVTHCFESVYDKNSRILILGTMPSPASRKYGFYYSHPRNRFWPVMAHLLGEDLPTTPEEKRSMALKHGFALWDVLSACEIEGASDASIKKPEPNDIAALLQKTNISAIFTTGNQAAQLYARFCAAKGLPECIPLPSTSPANARMKIEELIEKYSVIMPFLNAD